MTATPSSNIDTMSTMDSDQELTVPAALAANKHKVARKSAKGRKLMRWGPDEDQQLLLATEAVIIEGTVELDWNLVGEKMPQQVTGEAIKQHLYKVREARESAGMVTPAKAEGKSAFGTRRGVTRYPPVDPNATLAEKKKSRPEPKASHGKGKKAKDEDEDLDDEKKTKTPSKIKHQSLLFAPAIPREEASPSLAPKLIIKLANKKRKIKEEPEKEEEEEEDVARTTTTPNSKAPKKKAKKVKISAEIVVENESPVKKGRKDLISNFDLPTRVEQMKRASEASQVLAPHQEDPLDIKVASRVPTAPKEVNEDVRKYFKPATKKNVEPEPKKTVEPNKATVFTERALRVKPTRPDYRENAALSDDQQSEVTEVETNTKDDEYEPETLDGDGLEHHANKTQEELPTNGSTEMLVEDEASGSNVDGLLILKQEHEDSPSEGMEFLRSMATKGGLSPAEPTFVDKLDPFRQDMVVPSNIAGQHFDFGPGGTDGNTVITDFNALLAKSTDDRRWYEPEEQQTQQGFSAPAFGSIAASTQALSFPWDITAPASNVASTHPMSFVWPRPTQLADIMTNSFGVNSNIFSPGFDLGVVAQRSNNVEAQEGVKLNEEDAQEGGVNLGVYGTSSGNGQWYYDSSYDPTNDFDLMQ